MEMQSQLADPMIIRLLQNIQQMKCNLLSNKWTQDRSWAIPNKAEEKIQAEEFGGIKTIQHIRLNSGNIVKFIIIINHLPVIIGYPSHSPKLPNVTLKIVHIIQP